LLPQLQSTRKWALYFKHADVVRVRGGQMVDPGLSRTPIECKHTDIELETMFERLHADYRRYREGNKRLKILVRATQAKGMVGEFAPLSGFPDVGVVVIYQSRSGSITPFHLFCTLCHELGHARSWFNGTRSSDYEEAIFVQPMSDLRPALKRAVLDEEVRAWQLGSSFAERVGFSDDASYAAEATCALRYYFENFRLPPEPFVLPPR